MSDAQYAAVPAAPAVEAREGNGRLAELSTAVRRMRAGRARLRIGENTLLVIGGIIGPLGLIAVLLGWWGAAHTPNLFEQIPYLVSGGLFGLGLVFLGGFCYFAHWLTTSIRESRQQSAAILDALVRLEATMDRNNRTVLDVALSSTPAPPVSVEGPAAVEGLVATERGTMAHRPDCVVVAGKEALRAVSADDGLKPCKLCDPYP